MRSLNGPKDRSITKSKPCCSAERITNLSNFLAHANHSQLPEIPWV